MRLFRIFIVLFIALSPTISSAKFLGPYTGKVIDSQTGEPVEGAAVLFHWIKIVPQLIQARSELIEARLVYTDKNGGYRIPKFFANLGLSGMLESTSVVVYQPGYQAYTVRIWRDDSDSKPDQPFKEGDNIVKLDRVPPDFDHAKHYDKITDALSGMRDYSYSEIAQGMTWDMLVEINLKAIPEREEFLRRVEWENRRERKGNR